MEQQNNGLERVSTRQAAKELNMDVESVQYLMRNERLPIGFAMKKEKSTRFTYYIYRGLLEAEKERISNGKCKW